MKEPTEQEWSQMRIEGGHRDLEELDLRALLAEHDKIVCAHMVTQTLGAILL